MKEELPIFKFALREDLKNNKEFLPKQSEPNATGYDVRSAEKEDIILQPNMILKIPLGFRAFCPDGWWFQLHPRSSFFIKKEMITLIGLVDQDFPNQVCLVCRYLPTNESGIKEIKFGDLIGQIVPVKLQRMVSLEIDNQEFDRLNSERNAIRKGGFGSTGER